MMMTLITIYVLGYLVLNVVCNPALYDQRQTGDTNVRIDMKDVVFIAMTDGEVGDYDYSYDYSDLTVKPETMQTSSARPPISTSIRTTTTTVAAVANTPTTTPDGNSTYTLEKDNNTLTITPNKQGGNSSEPNKIQVQQPLNSHNYQIPVVVIHEPEIEQPAVVKPPEKHYVSASEIRRKNSNVTAVRTENLPLRNCSPGFFLDSKNRCKRIRRPISSQRDRPQLPLGLVFPQRPEALLKA